MKALIDGTVAVIGATACMAGLFVLGRRAAGAIDVPLSGLALLAVAACGIALVVCTDALAQLRSSHAVGLAARFAARAGLAAAVAALLGIARGGPATITAALATLATIAWPAAASLADRRRGPARPPASRPPSTALPGRSEATGERVVQRCERYEHTLNDGTVVDTARGRTTIRFAAGARTAIAHVGFCPPFQQMPRVDVACDCEGLEMSVAAAEVLPWGVRIECRLEEPAEESIDVEVAFHAAP